MEQKTEIPGIYKAGDGVLINKDNAALMAYKNRKNRERKLLQIEFDLEELRKDIIEIKAIIKGKIE